MSFRLRVLGLVTLVAVIAATVTALLTLQQASRQVTESTDTQRQDIDTISGQLTSYGRTHGTWEGVVPLVEQLAFQTGQRIHLVTEYGEVVVDTDTLDGEPARAVDSPPISVNPRPALQLPTDVNDQYALAAITQDEIDIYRSGVRLAACLTRNRVGVVATDDEYGVPRYAPGPVDSMAILEECEQFAVVDELVRQEDTDRTAECTDAGQDSEAPRVAGDVRQPDPLPDRTAGREEVGLPDLTASRQESVARCLSAVFSVRIDEVAPLPLDLYLGAVDGGSSAVPLSAAPILGGAGLVAALVAAGSLLLSRRVLRPIKTLTSASHRVGQGDLGERVPVAGHDELAGLARSFNRMADSLQRAELRQRRLLADVAHELRTPLANLRGYLEALKDGVVSPGPELFASLHDESVLQQRIVDDLQDLALAEAGTLVYHRSRVDLGELLETCRTAHQAVAEAAGVELATRSAEPVYLHADPDRLRQVLGNLVGNALRATPAGGSVTLTGVRVGAWAIVAVSDTGAGIAPEHLPYVFDRFWRADAARGRATGGSGLGLAIARQIVSDHAGTIEVASQLGSGTRFTIRLPVDPSPHRVEPRPGLNAATGPRGRAGLAAPAPGAAGSARRGIRPS